MANQNRYTFTNPLKTENLEERRFLVEIPEETVSENHPRLQEGLRYSSHSLTASRQKEETEHNHLGSRSTQHILAPERLPTGSGTSINGAVTDSEGSVLIGGYIVFVESPCRTLAVYFGNGDIVRCDKGGIVVKEKMEFTGISCRLKLKRGRCHVYDRGQRVARALGMVGRNFITGGWQWKDFPVWVCTGLNWEQAIEGGFKME